IVDVVEDAWPDGMGDPKEDADLFAAWSMGFLGTVTYPGGLARAVEQSHAWSGAGAAVARHQSFVRLMLTYAVRADQSDAGLHPNYKALDELRWLTSVWRSVLNVDSAICAFDPSGEVLVGAAGFDGALSAAASGGFAPLDLWSNIRMYTPVEGWLLL